jgi:glycosyltransferase involved in cell wall biosynthesis
VAFFTDSFHEVNGVAQTSRQFDAFARRRDLPFLRACVGPQTKLTPQGKGLALELARGATAFPVERDMRFDPLFLWRHRRYAASVLREFQPHLLHITGPSDLGILGVYLAHQLRIPIVASWHTNLHEFAARRLEKALFFLPRPAREGIARLCERLVLDGSARYYRVGKVLMAPNQELIHLLERKTHKPTRLMRRGIDTVLFDPAHRQRTDGRFVLGYVGRITSEKGVRIFAQIENALRAAGIFDYRFVIVGHGGEEQWLRDNLQQAEFPGVLRGAALAEAYADFDVFVFPSKTDTFGNVVLEAFASGVPVVVTGQGGPKFLVEHGTRGFVAGSDEDFVRLTVELAQRRGRLPALREAARLYAQQQSWNTVFEEVYAAYAEALRTEGRDRSSS